MKKKDFKKNDTVILGLEDPELDDVSGGGVKVIHSLGLITVNGKDFKIVRKLGRPCEQYICKQGTEDLFVNPYMKVSANPVPMCGNCEHFKLDVASGNNYCEVKY